jgi:hypothetical protein
VTALRADASHERSVRRAIAAYLVSKGWRFRRGSAAPWLAPAQRTHEAGYSLLGAAKRQVDLERASTAGRHARG